MKTTILPRRAALALVFGVSALVAVACSSTSTNPTPTGGGTTSIVTSSSSGSSSSSGTTSSSSGGTGGMGTGGMGTGGGTGGCVSTMPASNTDYLNACNGMTCQAFDNKGKLPLLNKNGTLPALP